MNDRRPLGEARGIADWVRASLSPYCERFQIAGSIRRGAETVKDVEAVAVPVYAGGGQRTLEGDGARANQLDLGLAAEIRDGRLVKDEQVKRWGEKYKRLIHVKSGMVLDLFIVTPPASWGVVFTIRTGPAEFSEALVTLARAREMRTHEGALYRFFDVETDHEAWTKGVKIPVASGAKVTAPATLVPTPEEADFFRALGLPYFPPEQRGNADSMAEIRRLMQEAEGEMAPREPRGEGMGAKRGGPP